MMEHEQGIQLDLNSPVFQRQLFKLQKNQQSAVLNTLRKIIKMSWRQLYQDRGLNWEAILSRKGSRGERLYSLRIAKGFRAIAVRDGSFLRILSLHPDHDTAYRSRS